MLWKKASQFVGAIDVVETTPVGVEAGSSASTAISMSMSVRDRMRFS